MTDSTLLYEMAELAEACYAKLSDTLGEPLDKKGIQDALQNSGDETGYSSKFSVAQTASFLTRYKVINQQLDMSSGFSATLFERLSADGITGTGEYVFATKGTAGPDDIKADAGDIIGDGLAWEQIIDMYNYWQRLSMPEGAVYQKAVFEVLPVDAPPPFLLDKFSGESNFIPRKIRIDFSPTNDSLGLMPAGAELNVAGHSLGGHLASAFTRLFPDTGANAYGINGAGYSAVVGRTSNIDYVFSALNGAPAFDATRIETVFGAAGINMTTQDSSFGLHQYGSHDEIFTESYNYNPNVFGHGASQITDTLAVFDLFFGLDPNLKNLSVSAAFLALNPLFESASEHKERSLESVLDSMAQTVGLDLLPVPIDNRDALYLRLGVIRTKIGALQATVDFFVTDSADTLAIRAKTDFSVFLALKNGTEFALSPIAADKSAYYSNAFPELYTQWNADMALPPHQRTQGNSAFSDLWLQDRARLLLALKEANTSDGNLASSFDSQTWRISDRANARTVTLQPEGQIPEAVQEASEIAFSAEINSPSLLEGGGGSDRLYGSKFNDSINGGGGRDFIFGGEGNDAVQGDSGDDRLFAGGGTDTIQGGNDSDLLVGGEGHDTLFGGDGEDYLYGLSDDSVAQNTAAGEEADILIGGKGLDHYFVKDGDVVMDEDKQGTVIFQNYVLKGGVLFNTFTNDSGVKIERYLSSDRMLAYDYNTSTKDLKIFMYENQEPITGEVRKSFTLKDFKFSDRYMSVIENLPVYGVNLGIHLSKVGSVLIRG